MPQRKLHTPWLTSGNQNSNNSLAQGAGIAISPFSYTGHSRLELRTVLGAGTTYMRIRGAAGSRMIRRFDGVALELTGRPDRFLG